MTPIFEYWQSEVDEQWYFHIKIFNNGILAQSVGYTTRDECMQAIDLVKFYADIAPVLQPDAELETWA